MDSLTRIIDNALVQEESIDVVSDALEFMNNVLYRQIVPHIKTLHESNAWSYRTKRDEENVTLFALLEKTIRLLNLTYSDDTVHSTPMSSICARMNLIGESDIDIGILVKGLNLPNGAIDESLFDNVTEKIKKLGYRYSHTFNEHVSNNRYFSFCQMIDGIEMELKVRDYDTAAAILRLHNWLDTRLSDEDITIFTYTKYLLKIYDNQMGTTYYKKFKKILYEAMFHCVGGTHLL